MRERERLINGVVSAILDRSISTRDELWSSSILLDVARVDNTSRDGRHGSDHDVARAMKGEIKKEELYCYFRLFEGIRSMSIEF